jgi:hypothetical protein
MGTWLAHVLEEERQLRVHAVRGAVLERQPRLGPEGLADVEEELGAAIVPPGPPRCRQLLLPQRLYVVRQHASIVVLPELDDRVPIDRDRSSSRTIISSSFRGAQRLAEAPKPLHDVCSGSVYAQAPAAGSGVA